MILPAWTFGLDGENVEWVCAKMNGNRLMQCRAKATINPNLMHTDKSFIVAKADNFPPKQTDLH